MTETHEWVVVFYPPTGATRLLPNLDLVSTFVARSSTSPHVFKSPIDFQRRFDHLELEKMWKNVFKHPEGIGWPNTAIGPLPTDDEKTPPDCDTETLTRELWHLLQRVGDRIYRVVPVQTRPKECYDVNLDLIQNLEASDDFKKAYPKQCRVIISALKKVGPTPLERQLKDMMLNLVATGQLKTKQDPWLIMQFYRKKLIDAGIISRGGITGSEDNSSSED